MPRRREGARVVGPYQEATRCRVVVVVGKKRENHFAPDWSAALRLAAKLRRKLAKRSGRQFGELIDEYRDHRLAKATAKPETIIHADARIRLMLESWLDADVGEFTPARADEVYAQHVARPSRWGRPYSPASHRWDLKLTRAFCRWGVSAGHLDGDPFAAVVPVGKVRTGKPQLRLDEARQFSDVALASWRDGGDQLALAALLGLWLGLRASEALRREVRDLDDSGRVLWVPSGKTANARRRLTVPEALRGPLLQLAGDRSGAALLFAGPSGHGFRRTSLARAVYRLCQRAGVPIVCPHSLRGLHSTLALGAGATSEAVAAALGHGSFAMTQRHYVAPGTVEAAAASRVADALGGVSGGSAELLHGLDEATLRELLALLAERKRGR